MKRVVTLATCLALMLLTGTLSASSQKKEASVAGGTDATVTFTAYVKMYYLQANAATDWKIRSATVTGTGWLINFQASRALAAGQVDYDTDMPERFSVVINGTITKDGPGNTPGEIPKFKLTGDHGFEIAIDVDPKIVALGKKVTLTISSPNEIDEIITWTIGKVDVAGEVFKNKGKSFEYTATEAGEYVAKTNSKEVKFTVVGISKLQYKLAGNWTDVPSSFSDIGKETSITFKAIAFPSSATTWPTGYPKWQLGGSDMGVGEEQQISFASTGSANVVALCGDGSAKMNKSAVGIDVVDNNTNTVAISWSDTSSTSSGSGSSTTGAKNFSITYTMYADVDNNKWITKIESISGGATIYIRTGGSRDPIANPPINEAEAQDAVTVMKDYYSRGSRGSWHTADASIAHEDYHSISEWRTIGEHYWSLAEEVLEKDVSTEYSGKSKSAAISAVASKFNTKKTAFQTVCKDYWSTLSDSAGSRPYAAGQLVLNSAIQSVQNLAASKTPPWAVPSGVDTPSTANPCYQPWINYP
jgi:hypothetical protein